MAEKKLKFMIKFNSNLHRKNFIYLGHKTFQKAIFSDYFSKISTAFEEVEGSWNTLYGHIKNAYTKADDVNQKYVRLKTTSEKITENNNRKIKTTQKRKQERLYYPRR